MGYMCLLYFTCTHRTYVLVSFGVYVQMKDACFIWRVQIEDICLFHLACTDGTCLFNLACTDWIYVLVLFSMCRWKMLVLFGLYKITGKQTVAPVRFFPRNSYHLASTDATDLFSLACTHEIYVLVLFGVYRWKMHHGANGTCLFYLACTDGRYMLVSFGVYRWNMFV